ncbi:hypothetical protein Pcinc_010356 [Petrolisthes cinctipes]|uniref:Sulfotransferase n=1 Tax=Petrolisthes cinctipes TaxID=88211 RepID=A0AAE1KTP6_PETCI|nr:hypothetical protein Pcinc_010356 [Petrolisthes cinctipes]
MVPAVVDVGCDNDCDATLRLRTFESGSDTFGSTGPCKRGGWNGNNEPTTYVLLVSSMGRSGSSFLSQILSSVPSAFYYYEPLYMLHNHLQEDMVWQGLKGLFTCNILRKFLYAAVDS